MRFVFSLVLMLFGAAHAQILDTVIKVPGRPDVMLYVPEGNKLYVRAMYTSDTTGQSARLCVIDCATRSLIRVYDMGRDYFEEGGAFNWRRNKVYFGAANEHGMLVIDNAADSIVKMITSLRSHRPAYDSRHDKLYTVSLSNVSVIDCSTDSVIKNISQPLALWGFVTWDSVNNCVYAGTADHYVAVIDCTADSVVSVIDAQVSDPAAASLYPERSKLYATSFWRGTGVIDCEARVPLRRLNWIASWWASQLSVTVNPLQDRIYYPISTIDTCDPDSTDFGDTVDVLCGSNDSAVVHLPAHGYVCDMRYAPWSDRLYVVASFYSGASRQYAALMQVFDCSSNSPIGRADFGTFPFSMELNARDREVYVADNVDSAVYFFRDTIVGAIHEKMRAPRGKLNLSVLPSIIRPGASLNLTFEGDGAAKGQVVSLKLFDCSGQLVAGQKVVLDQPRTAVSWMPSETPLAAGVYVLTMNTGQVRRKVVVR
jgi:DNA-binding beta-propeller fold protein YncE